MIGVAVRWFCGGLMLATLITMSGCVTQVPPSGPAGATGSAENAGGGEANADRGAVTPSGGDGGPAAGDGSPSEVAEGPAGGDETPFWDGGAFRECGERTVVSPPGPGFLELEASYQLDATPADSPLAKVLFGGVSCREPLGAGNVAILYEVGQQGEVLSVVSLSELGDQKFYVQTDPHFSQRFSIEDGCLTLGYDTPDPEERPDRDPTDPWGEEQLPTADPLPDYDPTEIPKSPCEMGQLAIGREGQIIGEPEGAYICVQVGSMASACRDCWFDGEAWHMELVASGSYVALGSIDNVSVARWAAACDQPDERVSIAEGDRVEFTWTMRATYRTSPSPEELGYQEFELPMGP